MQNIQKCPKEKAHKNQSRKRERNNARDGGRGCGHALYCTALRMVAIGTIGTMTSRSIRWLQPTRRWATCSCLWVWRNGVACDHCCACVDAATTATTASSRLDRWEEEEGMLGPWVVVVAVLELPEGTE